MSTDTITMPVIPILRVVPGSGPREIFEGSNPTNHTPEPYHTTDDADKMWSFEEVIVARCCLTV